MKPQAIGRVLLAPPAERQAVSILERPRTRGTAPRPAPLAERARELVRHLQHVALRKSKVLWELDLPLARRCSALAKDAEVLAFRLELLEKNSPLMPGGAVAARLNLAAAYVKLEAEADSLAPRSAPASGRRHVAP